MGLVELALYCASSSSLAILLGSLFSMVSIEAGHCVFELRLGDLSSSFPPPPLSPGGRSLIHRSSHDS